MKTLETKKQDFLFSKQKTAGETKIPATRKGKWSQGWEYPAEHLKSQLLKFYAVMFFSLTLLLVTFLCLQFAHAEEYSNSQIANAIKKAENSVKYPYGIKSIPTYGNEEYARKICLNTIRNHRKRHKKHNCGIDFITCLAFRYAPIGVKNDPNKFNQFWEKNVRYFLEK